jgi:hypothetical protein
LSKILFWGVDKMTDKYIIQVRHYKTNQFLDLIEIESERQTQEIDKEHFDSFSEVIKSGWGFK